MRTETFSAKAGSPVDMAIANATTPLLIDFILSSSILQIVSRATGNLEMPIVPAYSNTVRSSGTDTLNFSAPSGTRMFLKAESETYPLISTPT